jgi:GWxTD domain-containing protein
MKARLLLCLAVVVLGAPALFASSLEKYRDWPNSPQGYFMTSSERAEWTATVKTDAEAEAFIKKFLAKRDAGFVADVASRATMADKHLTVSGRAGSLTTRGKIVILLGPPSSFNVSAREVKGQLSGTPDMYSNVGGGGGRAGGGSGNIGPAVGDMAMAANARAMSADMLKDYTFVYAADKLPGKQSKDLSVVVEVKAGDGSDRILDRKQAAMLDDLFEQVAAARIVNK